MKIVNIKLPFTLTLNNGTQMVFKPGEYEVEDEVADHFYLKAHSTNPPFVEPKAGTPEAAQLAAKRIQRRRILEQAAEIQAEEGGT